MCYDFERESLQAGVPLVMRQSSQAFVYFNSGTSSDPVGNMGDVGRFPFTILRAKI